MRGNVSGSPVFATVSIQCIDLGGTDAVLLSSCHGIFEKTVSTGRSKSKREEGPSYHDKASARAVPGDSSLALLLVDEPVGYFSEGRVTPRKRNCLEWARSEHVEETQGM